VIISVVRRYIMIHLRGQLGVIFLASPLLYFEYSFELPTRESPSVIGEVRLHLLYAHREVGYFSWQHRIHIPGDIIILYFYHYHCGDTVITTILSVPFFPAHVLLYKICCHHVLIRAHRAPLRASILSRRRRPVQRQRRAHDGRYGYYRVSLLL